MRIVDGMRYCPNAVSFSKKWIEFINVFFERKISGVFARKSKCFNMFIVHKIEIGKQLEETKGARSNIGEFVMNMMKLFNIKALSSIISKNAKFF